MGLFAICMSSLGKCLLKSFAYFLGGALLVFLLLNFVSFLYFLDTSPMQIYDLQKSSTGLWLPFVCLFVCLFVCFALLVFIFLLLIMVITL